MFVYSIKASTIKLAAVICVSVAALITLISVIPTNEPTAASVMYSEASTYNFGNVKTGEDRIMFLRQFGIEVDATPVEEENVTVPGEFDRIFVSYNELQKQQGLDLSKYKRKTVSRYTYKVINYPDYDGTVYANIIVYRGKVISGDLCSADVNGFVKSLDGKYKLP